MDSDILPSYKIANLSKSQESTVDNEVEIDPSSFIHIKGARGNNLKNIELVLPKEELIVVTGLSGSGKSSLVMDTLYAEGQRRYVESLSSYARQFLNRMKKPEVDFINGISPAIAIEQRVSGGNSRSTVGSMTEVYDYLRLLFARIGKTYSPKSGMQVKKHSVRDVINFIVSQKTGSKLLITAPLSKKYGDRTFKKELELLLQRGFTRIYYKGDYLMIEELIDGSSKLLKKHISKLKGHEILIDRIAVDISKEDQEKRIADSVLTAFDEGEGNITIHVLSGERKDFNNRFELDGMEFLVPTPQLFNYNNAYGACPKCEGYGRVLGIDEGKVIPNPHISVFNGAIACWRHDGAAHARFDELLRTAHHYDFPLHTPYKELTEAQVDVLWNGNSHYRGIYDYFDSLKEKTYKIQNRIILARYRGRTKCPECKGSRLNKQARYVQVDGRTIADFIHLPIDQLYDKVDSLSLSDHDLMIAKRILYEIMNRLRTMLDVGLPYLSLDRLSATLSGGETQRIHLTRTLGSTLTDSIYILDEPSIGLHPKDTENLVQVLKNLRDLANTVIVVEHEEAVIKSADYIVDMGPGAGIHGGEVCYSGTFEAFKNADTLTADYLMERKMIELPKQRRKKLNWIKINKASKHNLKSIDVRIPLQNFVLITGVSGSGKSTLIRDIFLKELEQYFLHERADTKSLSGDLHMLGAVEYIGQKAIGKSSRSNPATYVKAFDAIRNILSKQALSRIRAYSPKFFSFNTEGGRCESCKGDGYVTVEMQFLADVKLICDECKGHRFKSDVLEVQYNGKNISDILELSVEEALEFFADQKEIVKKIQPLFDVGLSYIKLGQSSSTLSGGEAQRLKLASFLLKENPREKILFLFDEPTTGLHFQDIEKLLYAMNALIERGHSVIVIEHNLDVIKCADYIVDLGPEGGINGGYLVYQGEPEGIVDAKESVTGKYLKDKLKGH